VRPGIAVLIAATLAATISLVPHPAAAATRPSALLVPGTGALVGAYVDPDGVWSGNSTQQGEITSFESRIGRKLAIVQHYYSWTNAFPSGLEQWDIAGGRIPLVSWAGTSLDAILSGSYDSMIRARADGLKALGSPVFLRWCWEMNGNWYTCDGTHNNSPGTTNGPAKFVAAWRHLHDLFVAQGATNVVWVWSPNGDDVPSAGWNHYTNYYPGDAYVDWVGIDGYNWGSTRSWSSWRSFSSLFSGVYSAYATRKPIMIAETSSAEQGGSKADWITSARASIQSQFPAIAAVVWFDVLKENDWRPDSSGGAFTAFRSLVGSRYFGGSSQSTTYHRAPVSPLTIARFTVGPKPMVQWTRIRFRLPVRASVTVAIRRVSSGHVVRTLRRGKVMRAGPHHILWKGRNQASRRVEPGLFEVSAVARTAHGHAKATDRLLVLRRRR
jgi:endoglucanase